MKYVLAILMLCSAAWGAISFHASSTGPNPNGGSFSMTLPTVSNNDCVIAVAVANIPASGGTPYAAIAGWTTVIDVSNFAVFQQIWTTGASTSITFVPQNSAGSWETSYALSYSGANTSTCIDDSNYTIWDQSVTNLKGQGTFYANNGVATSPAVSPTNTTDMLIVSWLNCNPTGGGFSASSGGITNRVNQNPGPNMWAGEVSLSVGTPTSWYGGSANTPCAFAFSLALLPASGGSTVTQARQPTIVGSKPGSLDFTSLFPNSKDLVCVSTDSSATVTTSGYTTVWTNTTGTFACRRWTTGDATTYAVSGTCNHDVWVFHNPAQSSASNYVYTDAENSVSSTLSGGGTVTIPGATEQVSNELTFGLYQKGSSAVDYANPASTYNVGGYSSSSPAGAINYFAQQNPAIPTVSYATNMASSGNYVGGFVTLKIGPTASTRYRGQVIQVN